MLYNNIYGQQNTETTDIVGNTSSIASVSTKQLADIKSGYRLSPSNSTVCLFKELIVPTLYLKKRLTNI